MYNTITCIQQCFKNHGDILQYCITWKEGQTISHILHSIALVIFIGNMYSYELYILDGISGTPVRYSLKLSATTTYLTIKFETWADTRVSAPDVAWMACA